MTNVRLKFLPLHSLTTVLHNSNASEIWLYAQTARPENESSYFVLLWNAKLNINIICMKILNLLNTLTLQRTYGESHG